MAGAYTYNNQLQLGSIAASNAGTAVLNLTYNYGGVNDNGQISGITDGVTPAASTSYVYDELGRLKIAQTTDLTSGNTWKLKFSYDRYGNRVSEIPVAGTANMPTSQVPIDPATNRITSLVYDADGNVVNDNLHSYAYNGAGQITSVDGSNNSYAYDPAGLRVNRNGTIYIYSGGSPIAEYPNGAAAGSPGVEYLYAGGRRVASVASGVFTYLYSDHLSTRVQAGSAGAVTRTFGHFPFGESWYETGTADKWKLTTYERDSESGLDYAHARFDSPALGRFMSLDPLGGSTGNPQSLNRYAYVANDPINFSDTSGAESHKVCLLNDHGDETNFCVGGGFIDGQFVFGSANLFQSDFFMAANCFSCLQIGQTTTVNGRTFTVGTGEDGNPAWFNDANGTEIGNPGELGLPDNNPLDTNVYFVDGSKGGGDAGNKAACEKAKADLKSEWNEQNSAENTQKAKDYGKEILAGAALGCGIGILADEGIFAGAGAVAGTVVAPGPGTAVGAVTGAAAGVVYAPASCAVGAIQDVITTVLGNTIAHPIDTYNSFAASGRLAAKAAKVAIACKP